MIHEKRFALSALSLIFLFFFGFSLFINLPPIHQGFLFADRGDVALRGFEDPVRLYEVRWREDA